MAPPIQIGANVVDLSQRFGQSKTVAGSPALAAETIICSLTIPAGLTLASGVWVGGWAAYTVGTSGTAVTLRIRQTGVAGTLVVSTGALTKTAAQLFADDVQGFDAAAVDGGVYVLTMQVTAGAAVSTVSAVQLLAWAI